MFNSETWLGNVNTGFYSHLLDQSLKFNDDDSQYLTRTITTNGDRKKSTFSCWFKLSKLSGGTNVSQILYNQGDNAGTNHFYILVYDDTIYINDYDYGSSGSPGTDLLLQTNRKFRDTSAWHNLVLRVDTTQSTAADRARLYINGVQETSFSSSTYPSQNSNLHIMNQTANSTSVNTSTVRIGNFTSNYNDGYMAEVNYCDGQSLGPDSFGETAQGIWTPKDTSGLTFGTNGFHLTFKDDVVSEGFNTATFTAKSSTAESVSGLGFAPDFVWTKARNTTQSHQLFDSVRGDNNILYTNLTNTESAQSAGYFTLENDGFNYGTSTFSANTYVAWAWEAGGTPTADNSAGAGATPTAGSVKIDGSNLGSALAGTIPATRISANTARGFSIVTFEGTQTAGSVAHGLSSAPKWIIAKNRDSATEWPVYHESANSGGGSYLRLDGNAANTSSSIIWTDSPSSTVVNIGTYEYVNRDSMVLYCWAEVSGYSKFGSFTGNGGSQAIDVGFKPAWVMLRRTNGGTWAIFDNTRQSQNLQMLGANSNAAETTNSQMTFSGNTFNDNGYISDSGATVLYMAFADTREAAFFKDVSSNGNHFTPVNLDYRDSVPDVPTNNFCTWNPLYNKSTYGGHTYSEGNLKVTTPTSNYGSGGTTFAIPPSGKWYAEVYIENAAGSVGIALNNPAAYVSGTSGSWYDSTDGIAYYSANGYKYLNASSSSYGATFAAGDIIGIAVNTDDNEVTFYKNNSTQGAISKDATGYVFDVGDGSNGAGSITVWNFGQDSSFSGAKATANSNADGNGHGSFAHAPPSGFLALCSQNLPDPSITDGTEHFNTVLYTAASSNGTYNITGVGFQPDFSWVKNRDDVERNLLFDSVRGNTSMTDKFLVSDAISAEGANGVTGTTVTVNADGMQIVESSIDSGELYFNSRTYVMWNWKAGGTAASNSDGSITSSVSAGEYMSICTWTGDGNSGATIGHGLGKVPSMILVKRRNTDLGWTVYHEALGTGSEMYLNMTQAVTSSNFWLTSPTTSVFSVSSSDYINASGDTYVGYVFANLEGACKAGSYVGNGNADGPFIHVGFRVSWIMIRNKDDAGEHWEIWDSVRDPDNVVTKRLRASSTGTEASSTFMDFVANGVKLRNTSGGYNSSGKTFIYLAFADQPFKFANAR
jgi:hypothetical protein|tara:strand:- start:1020 stop:4496 length:3477 start_codon:yes stop_codon:yes gene_type:complete